MFFNEFREFIGYVELVLGVAVAVAGETLDCDVFAEWSSTNDTERRAALLGTLPGAFLLSALRRGGSMAPDLELRGLEDGAPRRPEGRPTEGKAGVIDRRWPVEILLESIGLEDLGFGEVLRGFTAFSASAVGSVSCPTISLLFSVSAPFGSVCLTLLSCFALASSPPGRDVPTLENGCCLRAGVSTTEVLETEDIVPCVLDIVKVLALFVSV